MFYRSRKLALTLLLALIVAATGGLEAGSVENAEVGSVKNVAVGSGETPRYSLCGPLGDFARDSIFQPKIPFELVPGKSASDWTFVLEPYVWAMGLSGDLGLKGLPTVNVGFSSRTIIQHLDWGIFLSGEVRKGRWGVIGDGYYAALSGSSDLEGALYRSGDLQVQQSLVSLALAYRIIDDRRGFLDVYAGARYNFLGTQVATETDPTGINSFSAGATDRIAQRIDERVSAAVQAVRAQVVSATQVAQTSIGQSVAAGVSSVGFQVVDDVRAGLDSRVLEAVAEDVNTRLDARVSRDLRERGLGQRGLGERSDRELRRNGLDPRRVEPLRAFYSDLGTESEIPSLVGGNLSRRSRGALAEYLKASVDLEIARVRGESTAALESRAKAAKAKASKELAADIEEALPTYGAGDAWWVDPLVGLRGQVNFTRWLFLAAQGDVGGFGAGSQIAWNLQATIGVNFTRNIFAELGYRYMYVDYQGGGLVYEMNSYGLFSSIGVKF